jgi:hypothetical protein
MPPFSAVAALAALWGVAVGVGPRPAFAELRIDFVPSLSLAETFSDNVDRVAGGERSGLSTNATPRLRLRAEDARLRADAGYGLNVVVPHYSGGEDRVDHDASATLDYRATELWSLRLRQDFRLSEDPTRPLAFVTPGGEVFRAPAEATEVTGIDPLDLRPIRIREDELRSRTSIGTSYDVTRLWAVGAEAGFTLRDVEDGVFRQDSETLGGRVSLTYRLSRLDDLTVSSGGDATDFDRTPNATSARVEFGWSRRLRTRRFSLSGGYALLRGANADGVTEEDHQPSMRATLAGDLADGAWRLAVGRDVTTDNSIGDASWRYFAEVGIEHRFARPLTGAAQLRYLHDHPLRGFAPVADAFEGTVSAAYHIVRWARVQAVYRHRRDDIRGGAAVVENSALGGLEILWPLGIRRPHERR